MKIKLEMEIDNEDILNEWFDEYDNLILQYGLPQEKIRQYLTQNLFEICEDWVLHGGEPDFEFEDEPKLLTKTK